MVTGRDSCRIYKKLGLTRCQVGVFQPVGVGGGGGWRVSPAPWLYDKSLILSLVFPEVLCSYRSMLRSLTRPCSYWLPFPLWKRKTLQVMASMSFQQWINESMYCMVLGHETGDEGTGLHFMSSDTGRCSWACDHKIDRGRLKELLFTGRSRVKQQKWMCWGVI